ncbi:trypsin-like peptidase domain-containing protein [Candidatus Latescibacterota bacterium]
MARVFTDQPACRFSHYKGLTIFFLIYLIIISSAAAQKPVIVEDGAVKSPFARVYENVSPSVVRIDVKAEVTQNSRTMRNPWQFFFENQPQQRQKPIEGMGSGVIIDREGHILTNNHVIAGADEITVKVNESEFYDATVIGADKDSDLAVIKLKLDGKKLPEHYVAELGDSDTLKPGDYAIAIGNPIGLDRSISVGVVSALGRQGFNVMGGQSPLFQNFIQTDAQINPGNSGGALADINGKVVGINDMYTAQYAGIGFAIPINLAKNVTNQLIASGEVKRGFVGVSCEKVITDEIQEAMELPTKEGALIVKVSENTPAEKAGLKHGDLIVSLNDKKINNFDDFMFKIGNHQPGDTVKMEILRDKKNKTVTLTLIERYAYLETNVTNTANWRGIHVVDITQDVVDKYKLGDLDSGVVVVNIEENKPASKSNLHEGDVIVEIEQKEIRNTGDFLKMKDNPDLADKTILIYKKRVNSFGEVNSGFVAIQSK